MLTAQISEEKRLLLDRLTASAQSLISAATGVPHECEKVFPADGCWSVLDVLEHITLADRKMWKRYLEAGPNGRPVNLDVDKFIQAVGLDRTSRRQAPEHVLPAGRFSSLAEAVNEYRTTRDQIVLFIEGSSENLREKLVNHPVGEMDGHQLFLLIAAHSDRHAIQIEEIKKSAAYQAALNQKAAS